MKVIYRVQSYNENWDGAKVSDHSLYSDAIWAAQYEYKLSGAKQGSILEHVEDDLRPGQQAHGTTIHTWTVEDGQDGAKCMFIRNIADR